MYPDTIIPTFSPHREALLTLCRMFLFTSIRDTSLVLRFDLYSEQLHKHVFTICGTTHYEGDTDLALDVTNNFSKGQRKHSIKVSMHNATSPPALPPPLSNFHRLPAGEQFYACM